jgi:asparagine synthetase B (glutamine-hydrolysing)
MIVFPKEWQKDYTDYIHKHSLKIYADYLLELMRIIVEEIKVLHLAYSGGTDSTLMLCLLTEFFGRGKIHTYTISSREDHPDILFASKGSELFGSIHHEFIVTPEEMGPDDFQGDNAVRQLFSNVKEYTDKIICCDGIDEFMCGYYDHLGASSEAYEYYISKLTSDHLIPLHKGSGNVKVYLPYLDTHLVEAMSGIDLRYKVDNNNRKKIISLIAEILNIPDEFINRNKYGFCEAFRGTDKPTI